MTETTDMSAYERSQFYRFAQLPDAVRAGPLEERARALLPFITAIVKHDCDRVFRTRFEAWWCEMVVGTARRWWHRHGGRAVYEQQMREIHVDQSSRTIVEDLARRAEWLAIEARQ